MKLSTAVAPRRRVPHRSIIIDAIPKNKLNCSAFCTQNAHGLWRKATDSDGNYIWNQPRDTTRFEHLIATMTTKNLDVYFIQDTWLEGNNFNVDVGGYHVFRHNGTLVANLHQGVVIVLSPRYYAGWQEAGGLAPVVLPPDDEFVGRFIGLTIKLECQNAQGRKVKGRGRKNTSLLVSVISAYHPCHTKDERSRFLDSVDSLLHKLPP
jgi:hypothetical protein